MSFNGIPTAMEMAQQRIAELEDLLEQCAEFIDGYVDVQDGDYGEPEPNKAMRLMSRISESVELDRKLAAVRMDAPVGGRG